MRAVVIHPEDVSRKAIDSELSGTGRVKVVASLNAYPSSSDLGRFLRLHSPDVIFLSLSDIAKALVLISKIRDLSPFIQFVSVAEPQNAADLLEAVRAGAREFMTWPAEDNALDRLLDRVESALQKNPPQRIKSGKVISFLPAKTGCGATTLAINTALRLARRPGPSPLLIDFDLQAGLAEFLLQLKTNYCIADAAEYCANLDESLFDRIVCKKGNLDVLVAGQRPEFRISRTEVRDLLECARRRYPVTIVDLSGMMERYSIDVMENSDEVCLVTTLELPAVHLAGVKLDYMRKNGLADRVRLIMNRANGMLGVEREDVESVLDLPVSLAFPNEYQEIQTAQVASRLASGEEFGKRCEELASLIAGNPTPRPVAHAARNPLQWLFAAKRLVSS